ncbi:unnamed protein product [Orchesella dallaii]|uniref:Uncharacterized protein n=1 Tax=Orchesella dallaii TaxID=48710 RepID=A0ABP1PJQ4_9HEXA
MKIIAAVVVLVKILQVYGEVTTEENATTLAGTNGTSSEKPSVKLVEIANNEKQSKKNAIRPGIASYLQGLGTQSLANNNLRVVTTKPPPKLVGGNNAGNGIRRRPRPRPTLSPSINPDFYEVQTSPQKLVTWRTTRRPAPLTEDKLIALQYLQILEQQEQTQHLLQTPPPTAPPPRPPYYPVKATTFKPIQLQTTEFEYYYEDEDLTTTTTTVAPTRRRRRRTTTLPSFFGAQQPAYLPPQQQQQPGYPPPLQQSGLAPQRPPIYSPNQQTGYPSQQPVYPPQKPGYPPLQPLQQPAGYPQQQQSGYPFQQQTGYPVNQGGYYPPAQEQPYQPLQSQQQFQQPVVATSPPPRQTTALDYYDYLDSLPSTTWKPVVPVHSGLNLGQTYPITPGPPQIGSGLNPALLNSGVEGLNYQQLLQLQRIKQFQYLMALQQLQLANQTGNVASTTEFELYKNPSILIEPHVAPTRITSTTENPHDAIHNIGGIFGSLAVGNLAGVVDSTLKLAGTGVFDNFNTWAACSIMKRCGEGEDEEEAETTTIKVPPKPPQDRYPVRRPNPVRY